MNETAAATLPDPTLQPISKPVSKPAGVLPTRRPSKTQLLPRVDIWTPGCGDMCWATVASFNRTRCTVLTNARFKPNTRVALRFHFHLANKLEVTEDLEARVAWQNGHNTAVDFYPQLTAGSPALSKAPHLGAHLQKPT